MSIFDAHKQYVKSIQSNIRLFADDTIMYPVISNQGDCQSLQRDLTQLETWEQEWLMAFNPEKCKVTKRQKEENLLLLIISSMALLLNVQTLQNIYE